MPVRSRCLSGVVLGQMLWLLAGCADPCGGPQFPPEPNYPPDHRYTLDELIDLSVHRNPGLEAARNDVEVAQSIVDQVKALWLPAIRYDFAFLTYSNDLNYKERPFNLVTLNIPLTGNYNFVNSVNYAQILATFGKRTSGLKQARMLAEMVRLQVLAQQDFVACEVANLYYAVCLTNEIDLILDDTLRRLKIFQEVVQQLNRRGSLRANKLDALEADLVITELEQLRTATQAGRQTAYAALKRAVGLNRDEPLILRDATLPPPISYGEAVSVSASIIKGFCGRPETRQADLFAAIKREQVHFAKTLFYPNIATLDTFVNTQGDQHPVINALDGLVISLILDVPIYDPSNRARLRAALYAEKASEALRQLVEQLLVLEIETTALEAQRSLKGVLQSNRFREVASEHERAARQAYSRELIPPSNGIIAIALHSFARIQHVTAVFAYHSARARLNRVTANREARYGW